MFPLTIGAITLTGWDGYSYVDVFGRTYWSGAATPSAEDAADCVTTQRTPPQLSPVVRSQSATVVISRMTDAEVSALYESQHPSAQRAVLISTSEGLISEAHPMFSSLVYALDQLGIIALDRWDALLAP